MSALASKNLTQVLGSFILIKPINLLLTKDYATAAALSHIIPERLFVITDDEFATKLYLTNEQFKIVKNNLRKLEFLTIKTEDISAKNSYFVDFDKYVALVENSLEY